ncbi:MAG: DNA repair protein RecN [Muribaculaceae bacterium]|nr:DNA repair protein RecN [Muribaculaceae bacterium]
MLKHLHIENYALIEKSSIDFGEGFTVITGETGSGKSIMLDALSLLNGGRADTKVMGEKTKKTVVEAVFNNVGEKPLKFLESREIPVADDEIIIRREIQSSGKSRIFINDSPVTLTTLEGLSESLIDIHTQNSNILLNDSRKQTEILDAFAANRLQRDNYHKSFKSYVELRSRIIEIKESEKKHKENKEFIEFRLEQLDKLKPKAGELNQLEKEYELLSDADRIKSDLAEAYSYLDGDSRSALKELAAASSILEGIDMSLISKEDDNITERLSQIKVELRDISDSISAFAEVVEVNPARLEKIKNRIDSLYAAFKRFKVKGEEELVELYSTLKQEYQEISNMNADLPKMEKDLKTLAKRLKEDADALSESRKEAAEKFEKILENAINPLGLPNVKFEINITTGKMTSEGQDIVEFTCSFNKNNPLQPIGSIASGGEISRVMLGIKSVMAERMSLPTIIFDEIDTGVSGEIAHKMGLMMKKMGDKMQVLAVTHLPQVAVNAKEHLKVYKEDNSEKTVTHITNLTKEERITEIAGMLSGDKINDASLKNARSLMESVE